MSNKTKVLVIEDEDAQRRLIAGILRKEGLEVSEAPEAQTALDGLEQTRPDLILCDWRMPGMDGGQLLDMLRAQDHPANIIIMTAYGSISHAVQALKRGADDYLSKPFEREALLLAIRRVLKSRNLTVENQRLRQEVLEQQRYGDLLGKTPSMQRLYRMVGKIAATDATVLIIGESGTGKELVAQTLHQKSTRSGNPFIAVNCAAIPEALIESELFGHERGAFTGAHRRRSGKLEEARGGTLLLDEIPSMPPKIQGSLLRVLQERRYTPLGGQGEIDCDVRVIAASNRNLLQMVRDGTFREDLYYRLNVLPIQVPPLRQRLDDIPLLSQAFAKSTAEKYKQQPPHFTAKAMKSLMAYGWPGNVRELSNVVERLVLLCDGQSIDIVDLPEELTDPSDNSDMPFKLPAAGLNWDIMESSLLQQAMEQAAGNRATAARLLGLSYKTFLYRLEKYKLA